MSIYREWIKIVKNFMERGNRCTKTTFFLAVLVGIVNIPPINVEFMRLCLIMYIIIYHNIDIMPASLENYLELYQHYYT